MWDSTYAGQADDSDQTDFRIALSLSPGEASPCHLGEAPKKHQMKIGSVISYH